jgi:hypothetical protein
VVKYLAWCPRPVDDLESVDSAVREGAGVEIPPQYPIQGWASNRGDVGGAISVSSEQFPGSFPAWIWQG